MLFDYIILLLVTQGLSLLTQESISAKGLLGSHVGVPGQSALYDYIVIGGGTAGLTLARRLASNSSIRIAVIEAGDFYEFSNGNYSEVPAYASEFTGRFPTTKNPFIDWYTYTQPQAVSKQAPILRIRHTKRDQTLGNQSFLYDSGKMVGGSYGRNFLWQIRCVSVNGLHKRKRYSGLKYC